MKNDEGSASEGGKFLDLDQKSRPLSGLKPDWSHWIILGIGLLLLAAGIGTSLVVPKYPEMRSLMDACMRPEGAPLPQVVGAPAEAAGSTTVAGSPCAIAVFKFERLQDQRSGFSSFGFIANLLSAIGLALVISIVVTRTVERDNRKRFESALDRKTRELSEAVMRGMFNRRHPERLIDLVSENILQRELIRDRLHVHYVFKPWIPPHGKNVERLGDRRFIEVKATVSATMTNVSGSETLSGKTAKVPVCIVLPNPMYDELKDSVGVKAVQINGDNLAENMISDANKALQQDLATDAQVVSARFSEEELRPGQSMRLRMVYTMIKELEDSELFQTVQISKDLSITLTDATGWNLRIRAKSIGFGALDKVSSDDSTHHWTINDILLPHQGVLIWWKERLVGNPLPVVQGQSTAVPEGDEMANGTDKSPS